MLKDTGCSISGIATRQLLQTGKLYCHSFFLPPDTAVCAVRTVAALLHEADVHFLPPLHFQPC